MTLKTYGISDLVDWKAQIRAGKATVVVHFTGGAITRYGVTPAEYSTSDPFFQYVIEGSDYYKKGKIRLLRTTTVADDAATKARKVREAKRAMRKVAEDSEYEEGNLDHAMVEHGTPSETIDESPETKGEGEENEVITLTEVEVTCLQDALDYLKSNFGIATSKVRSYEKAQVAAAEHGVKFVGDKF